MPWTERELFKLIVCPMIAEQKIPVPPAIQKECSCTPKPK